MNTQLSITITGASLPELIAGAKKFVTANQTSETTTTVAASKKAAAKKAAPQVEETEEIDTDLIGGDEEETETEETDDALSFDSEDEEEAPKAKKAPKLTEKDVHAAAIAHAKKNTKAKTLELLQKKFKVKSIMELKPEQFAKAIEVLKV